MCSAVELVVDEPHVNTINCISSRVRQKRDLPSVDAESAALS
jgi:hypothetical protein